MRLIQLRSNDIRFKALNFNKGLNIIVGKKTLINDKKKTSNGIGKSLSLVCVDFMLGKSSTSKEISKLKLIMEKENIILYLTFEHNNERYTIQRTHNEIFINDDKCSKESEYLDFLNQLLNENYTFRNIFNRFFRTNKDGYIDAIKQVTLLENAYYNNEINSFLLGLDLEYLKTKKDLKQKQKRLTSLIKDLNEMNKNVNKEQELEYEESLKNIEESLKNFEISDDFHLLKKEADELTVKIQAMRNEISFLEREIKNKNNIISLNKQVDIDINKISNMYKEANFFIGEDVLAHIDGVKEFHNTLFRNRKNRATKDIKNFNNDLKICMEKMEKMDSKRSKLFKLLENKGALEEYHSLNKQKDDIKGALEEIQRNEKSLLSYKKEKADIEIEIDKFKKELIDLEDNLKKKISFLGKAFREISEEHYDDKPGFLDIEINYDFKTEKLYNINPVLKGDSSDGINEMKIFIYDMLIYKLNPNIIGLVGHDNRLFDMVDERQIAKALKYTNDNLSQYLCSMSDTKFKGVNSLTELDLNKLVIRSLHEKDKLFGFDFEE